MAGTETVSVALQWTLAELINHPEVYKKLRDEIQTVVGSNRLVEESDIPNLPYLQAVVKEGLRLHAPAPMIFRKAMGRLQDPRLRYIGEFKNHIQRVRDHAGPELMGRTNKVRAGEVLCQLRHGEALLESGGHKGSDFQLSAFWKRKERVPWLVACVHGYPFDGRDVGSML